MTRKDIEEGTTVRRVPVSVREVLWVLLVLLIVALCRLPSMSEPAVNSDESIFFTVAQDLASGGTLYRTSWDTRGPLQYYLFVPVIALFGNSIIALRLFTTLCVLLTMLFVYLISRRLFEGKIALLPPLFYGIFYCIPQFRGLGSTSEMFMMLPAVMALFFFAGFIGEKHNGPFRLFLAGLFSVAAILIKQTAFFTILPLIPLLVLDRITDGRIMWKPLFREVCWFVSGAGFLSLVIAGYLLVQGTFPEFFYVTFLYGAQYAASTPFWEAVRRLRGFVRWTIQDLREPMTMAAIASGLYILFRGRWTVQERRLVLPVLTLTASSLLGVLMGRSMWDYYFLQMALPFSLLTACALSLLRIRPPYVERLVPVLLIFAFLSAPLKACLLFPDTYARNRQHVLYGIADYLRAQTSQDERIYVLGGQPVTYFLSERKSPIPHLYWLHHKGVYAALLNLKERTLASLSSKPPKYFVYCSRTDRPSNDPASYLEEFMMKNYYPGKSFGDYQLYRLKEG